MILLSFSSLCAPGRFTVVAVALSRTSHLSLQFSYLFSLLQMGSSSFLHTFIFPFYSVSPLTQSISSQDVFLHNIHDACSMTKGSVYIIKHLWVCTCRAFSQSPMEQLYVFCLTIMCTCSGGEKLQWLSNSVHFLYLTYVHGQLKLIPD